MIRKTTYPLIEAAAAVVLIPVFMAAIFGLMVIGLVIDAWRRLDERR